MDVDSAVSITEAALILGVSPKTVRRRIREGALAAVRVERAQGYEYRIHLPTPNGRVRGQSNRVDVPSSPDGHGDHAVAASRPRPRGHGQPRSAEIMLSAVVAEQAREISRLNDHLIRLEQDRFELAGRLGYFQAELEHARETIKALQAPVPIDEPSLAEPPPPAHRPWWRFW